jgi:hypothetical protein
MVNTTTSLLDTTKVPFAGMPADRALLLNNPIPFCNPCHSQCLQPYCDRVPATIAAGTANLVKLLSCNFLLIT